MASMNMEEQLVDEQQPTEEKPINGDSQEPSENVNANGANLAKSEEGMDQVTETSTTTTMDLPLPSSRVPLPLELNCEIFKCLKLPIQRKFIWGLGRDIYGIFRQKLLKKTKRLRNPTRNRWNGTNTRATVAPNGLNVSITNVFSNVVAEQPFPISGPHCRADDFPGTILYYYEVKGRLSLRFCSVGLSGVAIPDWIGRDSNSYGIRIGLHCYDCWLAGEYHRFELPEGAIRPEMKQNGDVWGCGLVLDPDNNLAIFFTLNGKLMGRKIPISLSVDRLFPAICLYDYAAVEANFGDDPAKPFEYDLSNCSGFGLGCI